MDVEKTLSAIAESQRRAELRADRAALRADRADQRADRADQRADRADQRADRTDQRMDRADKRAAQFDKKLQATANLLNRGIQLVLESRKQTDFKLNALIDAQMRTEAAMKKTDEKFNRLLENLRRKNSNGHN